MEAAFENVHLECSSPMCGSGSGHKEKGTSLNRPLKTLSVQMEA
jgi:hypothetical protein